MRWAPERELRRWIAASRLDGFTALTRSVDRDNPADADAVDVLQRFRTAAMAAGARLPELLAAAD